MDPTASPESVRPCCSCSGVTVAQRASLNHRACPQSTSITLPSADRRILNTSPRRRRGRTASLHQEQAVSQRHRTLHTHTRPHLARASHQDAEVIVIRRVAKYVLGHISTSRLVGSVINAHMKEKLASRVRIFDTSQEPLLSAYSPASYWCRALSDLQPVISRSTHESLT